MLLAVGLFVVAPVAGDDDAKKDMDALQGNWVMQVGESNGEKLPEEVAKTYKRTITKDKLTITRGGEELYQGSFKIDPTKKPKSIDVTIETGPNKGATMIGIYELDGDTLKVCMVPPGTPRPSEFTGKAGSNQTCAIWKKEKK
jgi:uncharacterized protein (TIGR03067 family)